MQYPAENLQAVCGKCKETLKYAPELDPVKSETFNTSENVIHVSTTGKFQWKTFAIAFMCAVAVMFVLIKSYPQLFTKSPDDKVNIPVASAVQINEIAPNSKNSNKNSATERGGLSPVATTSPAPIKLEPLLTSTPKPVQAKTKVSKPAIIKRPFNGEVIKQLNKSGYGELKVVNGTNKDAAVMLISSLKKSELGFYIHANSTATCKGIVDGNYEVVFELGNDWDAGNGRFTSNQSASKFDKVVSFSTVDEKTQDSIITHYSINEITLHAIINGNARTSSMSKDEFDALMQQLLNS